MIRNQMCTMHAWRLLIIMMYFKDLVLGSPTSVAILKASPQPHYGTFIGRCTYTPWATCTHSCATVLHFLFWGDATPMVEMHQQLDDINQDTEQVFRWSSTES